MTFRAFVGSTEDEERVRSALSIFVPLDSIEATTVEGYFGNKILILDAALTKRDGLSFFSMLRENLSLQDRKRLKAEVQERTDGDCKFHIRLDKQSAYRGRVALTSSGDAIDVCAHIATYPSSRDRAVFILEDLL